MPGKTRSPQREMRRFETALPLGTQQILMGWAGFENVRRASKARRTS